MGTQFVSLPGHLEYLYRLAPAPSAQKPHYPMAEFKPEKGSRSLVKLIATMCQTDMFPSQPVPPWLWLHCVSIHLLPVSGQLNIHYVVLLSHAMCLVLAHGIPQQTQRSAGT